MSTTVSTDKSAPPLTNDEVVAAVSENSAVDYIKKFPRVDRNFADPVITNQMIGLVSFIPAKGAKPNDKGIYGFAKLRGNYMTEEDANTRAETLIRDIDSANIIYHTYVGRPFPLTNSRKYAAETSEVDIRRDTTEAVSSKIKEQKADDQKKAEEMKDRQQELMDDVSGNRPQEDIDLDEYITLNVKKAQLSWTYLEHLKKLREVRDLIIKTRMEVVEADKVHPDFRDSFFDKYNGARGSSGLETDLSEDQKQNGFLRYLVEDVSLPGIDEVDELVTQITELETIDQKRVDVVVIEKPEDEDEKPEDEDAKPEKPEDEDEKPEKPEDEDAKPEDEDAKPPVKKVYEDDE
jgi:hypothetical protein